MIETHVPDRVSWGRRFRGWHLIPSPFGESMMAAPRSPFSAAEQGLGYIYQGRMALLKLLALPEDTAVLIEKDDDIEFVSKSGAKSLASLKHKARGDTLTNLSIDFWKSVRIWLTYYLTNGRQSSNARFILFTTAKISETSFLNLFVEEQAEESVRREASQEAIARSESQIVTQIREELKALTDDESGNFFSRITIVDAEPRITDIPSLINQQLRTVRRESRTVLFERLEGWWTDLVIKFLDGARTEPIYGHEVSDKLSALAEEYRGDNLPITFRNRLPSGEIDVANDPRIFVEQLRALEVSANRHR